MLQKKICMLGSFGVGKTSLVSRFVYSRFSEIYHTTIGVKVDRKVVRLDDNDIKLIIWDIHGDDEFSTNPDGPVEAYVFKTISDPYLGRI